MSSKIGYHRGHTIAGAMELTYLYLEHIEISGLDGDCIEGLHCIVFGPHDTLYLYVTLVGTAISCMEGVVGAMEGEQGAAL